VRSCGLRRIPSSSFTKGIASGQSDRPYYADERYPAHLGYIRSCDGLILPDVTHSRISPPRGGESIYKVTSDSMSTLSGQRSNRSLRRRTRKSASTPAAAPGPRLSNTHKRSTSPVHRVYSNSRCLLLRLLSDLCRVSQPGNTVSLVRGSETNKSWADTGRSFCTVVHSRNGQFGAAAGVKRYERWARADLNPTARLAFARLAQFKSASRFGLLLTSVRRKTDGLARI
jgi:hypothetical protein